MDEDVREVGIVGGGISGLTVAHVLSQAGKDCHVFESSSSIGGWVQTEKIVRNDIEYIIDWGPQSFRSTGGDQPTSSLIRSLNLEIIMLANKRSIFTDGRIREVPMSLWKMANNSWMRGLLRGVFWDLLCPFRYLFVDHDQDESVHAFVTRHFGCAIREELIRAVAHGVYGVEIEELSVGVMMPMVYELARCYKSVLLGALITAAKKLVLGQPVPKKSMARGPYKVAGGMAALTKALANASTTAEIHLSCPVTSVTRTPNGTFDVIAGGRHFFCRQIVFTSNPNTISRVLGVDDLPRMRFQTIDVYAVFCTGSIPTDTFGYLMSRVDPTNNVLGVIFKQPGLLIVLARPLEHLPLSERQDRVKRLLETQLGVRVEDMFWRRNVDAIPVYDPQWRVTRDKLLESFRENGFGEGVHYIGDWTGRVGINHRVRAAMDAARDIIGETASPQPDPVGRWDSTRVVRMALSTLLMLCAFGVAKARGYTRWYTVRRIGVLLTLIYFMCKKMKDTRKQQTEKCK